MREYPQVSKDTLQSHGDALRFIAQTRTKDVQDWNNLPQTFMAGRKVGKVPSSHSDVASTDRIGDFNVTSSYAYFCVDNSGTTEWRRSSLGSW
jgi:hypothetical protein